jgi:hypothetical protein
MRVLQCLLAAISLLIATHGMGQPLDSVCIVTVMYADDTSRVDTASITYYDREGLEREQFYWFKGEKVPVHDVCTYDRSRKLKTQVTDFHGISRYKFRYRHGRLYSVTDYDVDAHGLTEKTGVTIWEYDDQGRTSRISNPPKWYGDYTSTFTYDSLGREKEKINRDEYGKEVYRSRTVYNVLDVSQLMAELDTVSLSAINVVNNDEHGREVERYELIKGKINSHQRHVYDEGGRLRTTIGLRSTTWYEYRRLPRRTTR